jgi:hypothetical protein
LMFEVSTAAIVAGCCFGVSEIGCEASCIVFMISMLLVC